MKEMHQHFPNRCNFASSIRDDDKVKKIHRITKQILVN